MRSIRCSNPECNQHVLQKSADGYRFRLKGRMTADDGGLHASCFWCGTDVTLPLDLHIRPPEPPSGERFILKKASDKPSP
jgi:hypothetical protein